MLVGHVAVAFVAKGLQPRLSLGTALVASVLADVLLFSFVLADLEHVEFRNSPIAGEYFTGADIALSHSLAMTLVWGVAIAAAYIWRRGERRVAAVLIAIAVTHWVLDVVSHEPYVPLAPGMVRYVGWSAFHGIVPVMVIEGAIWAGAVGLYVSDSRSTNSAGRYVFWGGVAALTYVWYFNAFGPPRGNPQQDAPIEGLILLLLAIGWAYWMNRAREIKDRPI